jgi:hypothetical protein
MRITEIILGLGLLHLTCGLLFGVPFIAVGVGRMDDAARESPITFRLVILPGTVAFWPLLAARWLKTYKKKGSP